MIPTTGHDAPDSHRQWNEIVTHLATAQVVVIPPDFRQDVMRRIARRRLRRDFILALQAGTATGLIIVGITASLLGWSWSALPLQVVHSQVSATFYETLLTNVIYALRAATLLLSHTRAIWSFVPLALLAVALCAAVAQFTLFRILFCPHPGNSPGRLLHSRTS